MKQANNDIRIIAKQKNVCLWEIAQEYGMTEWTFSRKLRKELPESEKKYICAIIEHIAETRQR